MITHRGSIHLQLCGMGSPAEAAYDPDNNRCRPCTHVERAVEAYRRRHAHHSPRLHYLSIPCDGSVVTGVDDIGCAGHKNELGQARIARFLQPRIGAIMQWN